jgi:hypothetical protein
MGTKILILPYFNSSWLKLERVRPQTPSSCVVEVFELSAAILGMVAFSCKRLLDRAVGHFQHRFCWLCDMGMGSGAFCASRRASSLTTG